MATPYCARVAILNESVERGGGPGGGTEAAWLAFGLEAPLGMWARGSYCARGRAWEGTTGEPPPLDARGRKMERWRFSPGLAPCGPFRPFGFAQGRAGCGGHKTCKSLGSNLLEPRTRTDLALQG